MVITQQEMLSRLHEVLMRNFWDIPDYAREYIEGRGLPYQYLKTAGCGYLDPNMACRLNEKAKDFGMKDAMRDIGFITPSEQYLTDAFYFPLYNHSGNIDSFSIRMLPDSEFVKNGGSPHWTMKVPISFPIGCNYPKSGLDPYRGRATFVCEGAIDTITLLSHGYNAIGLVGISNWRDQYIDFLNTSATVIAFDMDQNQSGQKAATKLARRLANAGMEHSVYLLELPLGEDINSFYSEDFFSYSKTHMHKFLETNAGRSWLEQKAKSATKVRTSDNQMSAKVEAAKGKKVLDVFNRLFPGRVLYEFQRGHKTKCPFHGDSRASLHLYKDTNSFFCFGCQAAGDTIDLVRRVYPTWDFNREVLPWIIDDGGS